MSNDTTPEATPAVTPETTPAQAATSTTPSPQAGDGNETISLEEARKLRSEAANLRKRMKAYEDAERAAQEAQLAEIDRVKQQHQAAEERIKHYQQQLVTAQVKLAATAKGIIDPDMAALAVQSSLEYDDDGMPSNLDKALTDLIKNKPYLAPKPTEPAPAPVTPAQTAATQRAPAVPAMNPGRANIMPPDARPPGRIPRLSDPGVLVPPGTVSKYQP